MAHYFTVVIDLDRSRVLLAAEDRTTQIPQNSISTAVCASRQTVRARALKEEMMNFFEYLINVRPKALPLPA